MNSSGLLFDHGAFKASRPEFRTNKTVFDVNLYLALGGWFLLLPIPLALFSHLIGPLIGIMISHWSALTSAASRGTEGKL